MKLALAGNPNCGKTTLFNALTGSSRYVGNWPGVTVEKIEGRLKSNKNITVTDLPGIYSLTPRSEDEAVSRNFLLFERPDLIINIIDASRLERSLYLTAQLAETGIPMIAAFNMTDIVLKNGDFIDTEELSRRLDVPIIEISALKEEGIPELLRAAENAGTKPPRPPRYSPETEEAVRKIESLNIAVPSAGSRRAFAVKILERDREILKTLVSAPETAAEAEKITAELEQESGSDIGALLANERYGFISRILDGVTDRLLSIPVFAAVMFLVYFVSVTTVGAFLTDWTNDVFFGEWILPSLRNGLESIGTADWLISLVADGIVGGVGTVLGFLPQLFVLFLFLSFLEDCGYMARVAFIMHRFFKRFGLSGKSFIALLISSGCGVPGIMAAKTIENEKSRRLTVITATFIPCGAKLPVIALIGGAVMGGAWWAAPSVYFIGIAAVAVSGIILKKTGPFEGAESPFVMELPDYHWPSPKGILLHVWERCRSFVVKAGTVIFLACAVIWFLSDFGFTDDGFGMTDIEESLLADAGNLIAPVFRPVGFGDWKAAAATVTGLVAKENIVGTLGVLLTKAETAEEDAGLWQAVAALFPSKPAAFAFLIFNILCAPCFAAIGAVRRQMNSRTWTLFAVAWQTLLAYAVALRRRAVYSRFGGCRRGSDRIALRPAAPPPVGTKSFQEEKKMTATIVISFAVAALLLAAAVSLFRGRKKGGCRGCPYSGSCGGLKATETRPESEPAKTPRCKG